MERASSISVISTLIDFFCALARALNASQNGFSIDTLVACPAIITECLTMGADKTAVRSSLNL